MRLVFLHGPAASGKLTTGRALSGLTGMPLFHNHLVVDALLEVFEFGSPEFVRLREEFWLSTFAAAAESQRSLIFTFTPEATVRAGLADRAASAVTTRDGVVHFVALAVSAAEQERRIENPDRTTFNKLASRDRLLKIRAEAAGVVDVPPADLTIDTDEKTATDSAALIHAAFDLPRVDQLSGYEW